MLSPSHRANGQRKPAWQYSQESGYGGAHHVCGWILGWRRSKVIGTYWRLPGLHEGFWHISTSHPTFACQEPRRGAERGAPIVQRSPDFSGHKRGLRSTRRRTIYLDAFCAPGAQTMSRVVDNLIKSLLTPLWYGVICSALELGSEFAGDVRRFRLPRFRGKEHGLMLCLPLARVTIKSRRWFLPGPSSKYWCWLPRAPRIRRLWLSRARMGAGVLWPSRRRAPGWILGLKPHVKYFLRPDSGTITASLAEAAKTRRFSLTVCGGRGSVFAAWRGIGSDTGSWLWSWYWLEEIAKIEVSHWAAGIVVYHLSWKPWAPVPPASLGAFEVVDI